MKSLFPLTYILFLCIAFVQAVHCQEDKIAIGLIGDSTVAPRNGWGDGFTELVKEQATVLNYAVNGATLDSLSGRLDTLLQTKPDYLIVQFGHNDMKGYDAQVYSEKLRDYIKRIRDAGATPIIFSPVTRRWFDENNKIKPKVYSGRTLPAYAQAAKNVAEETETLFLNLYALSVNHHNEIGPQESYSYNFRPNDRTHFNAKGGKVMAGLILDQLRILLPELRDEDPYFPEAKDAGARSIKLTWYNGRVRPTSVTVFRDGKKIGSADPATCTYVDQDPPRGNVDYRLEFVLPNGATVSLASNFPGRPEDFKGELGILDPTHNDGINPGTFKQWRKGDPYRLMFVSSAKTDATSSDLSTYDAFVASLAKKAGIGGSWQVFGGGGNPDDIKAHTQTDKQNYPDKIPVLLIDGKTRIANNYDDLWDSKIDAPINRTETGEVVKEGVVFAGTAPWGLGNPKRVGIGDPTAHNGKWRWVSAGTNNPQDKQRVYAISEVLNITLKD